MVRKWFVSLFPVSTICSVHSSSVIKVKDTISKGRSGSYFMLSNLKWPILLWTQVVSHQFPSVQGIPHISKEYSSFLAIRKLSCASTSSRKASLTSTPSLPIGLSPLSFPSPSLPWFLPVVLQLTPYYSMSPIRVRTLWRPGLCCCSCPHSISCI